MRTRYIRLVPFVVLPPGNYRSVPAEVGSASPMVPVRGPRPMEHPQIMSATAGVTILPLEPTNDSILAEAHLPAQPVQATVAPSESA